jgi:rhodanese-related sulfurtransferase
VREPAEIAMTGIVPGALTIPMGEFADKADPASADHDPALQPDKPIILYCASGKRSEAAGKYLLSLGYSKVFNLGGLKDWENAGLPVVEAG